MAARKTKPKLEPYVGAEIKFNLKPRGTTKRGIVKKIVRTVIQTESLLEVMTTYTVVEFGGKWYTIFERDRIREVVK